MNFKFDQNKCRENAPLHGKILTSIYLFIAFVAFLFLIYVGSNEGVEIKKGRSLSTTRTIDNLVHEEVKDDSAPIGMIDRYTWTVSDITRSDNCLAFYTVHAYTNVYMDGELVYSIQPDKKNKIGKTIGCNWVALPIYLEDVGKQITIDILPCYTNFQKKNIEFMLGDRERIFYGEVIKDLPQIATSLLMIVVGIVFMFILGYNYKKRRLNRNLVSVCGVSLLLGLWKITDARIAPIVFSWNPKLLSYLTLTVLLLIVVPIIKSIEVSFHHRYQRLWNLICGISCLVSSILLALQIFNIADLRKTLLISHAMIAVAAGTCIVIVANEWKNDRNKKKNYYKYVLFLLCLTGAGVDITTYYIHKSSSGVVFTMFAFLTFILVQGVIVIIEFYKQQMLLRKQEEELESSRIMIMLSQIQPHFMFNCLNSISYLCKADPDMAERAIVDFSDYLRANLDSLNKKDNVAFLSEIKHVKIYLSLEKMRFQDRLKIVYNIEASDFEIPALTVQPLVENAVKHGIGKKREGGTVTISTREEADCYEIVIADDGVGFEPGVIKDDGRSHIGISNVRNRLWKMSHATLHITSEVGNGCVATIRIPK